MKSKLLIVACLVIVLSMALILPLSIVNADYSDIVNDPNSIVNFNQYINFTSTSSHQLVSILNGQSVYIPTTLNQNIYCSVNIPFEIGHKYYFYTNIYSRSVEITNDSGTPYVSLSSQYVIFTSGGTATGTRFYFLSGMEAGTFTFSYIDLTQMFGQNSEPSLEQCKELFVSDYYNYTTGSPLAIGNLQGYAQGMSDAYSSMDITLSQYLVGSSAFAYNNTTIFDSSITYDDNVNAYLFSGVIGIPLLDTIKQGTNFEVDFELWNTQSGESSSYYNIPLNFGYVDSNNNLITISSVPVSSFVNNTSISYYGSFTLPISTDTIYIWLTYNLRSDPNTDNTDDYISVKSNITFRTYNVASMIKTAYAQGYENMLSYYQSGGQGYHDIYELGYNNGVQSANDYTFGSLMTAVVEAPVNAVLGMFNFDFLGYNFRNVITLIITLLIILAIVRLFIGMGASE